MIGIAAQVRDRAAALALHQIPFVDGEHDGAALALDQVGDAQILLLEPVLRIHHHHDDFGKAHRAQRVGDRELLELLLDPRAPAQARGVEHAKLAALPVDLDRDGIARGAGLRARQQALLAEQMIDQRRLAGIGPADDGDADRTRRGLLLRQRLVVLGFIFLDRLRHQLAQRVIELAHALAVLGRDLDGIAEAEREGLHRAGIAMLAFALVGDQQHRLVGLAGEIGEGAIVGRQARCGHRSRRTARRPARSRPPSAPACARSASPWRPRRGRRCR